MIRVISGKYRGRKLNYPSKDITRPTMDRVKESIFNMIQFKIKGSIVLDLFSGSGSLAIEALSREAIKAIAVDNYQEAITIIKANAKKIGINNIEIIKADVIDYIKSAIGKKFDFIFVDPPFSNYDVYFQVFQAILKTKILKKYGLIIIKTNNPQKIKIPTNLIAQKQRKYGISYVLLISNNI